MTGEYSGELIIPKEGVVELILHTPEFHDGYNAAGELIKTRKLTRDGDVFERQFTSPKITDYEVDYWEISSAWGAVRGQ